MKNIFIIVFSIFVLFSLTSCASSIKPISGKKLDGSQSQIKRTLQPVSNYSNYTEIKVVKGFTNTIQVNIVEDGKVLTTIPVKIITPDQSKFVQITGDIKKESVPYNWFLTIRYFGIVFIILLVILYFVGWEKIKEFIISPFKKKP